jgi:uncharacterized protein YndB with AHSA1/START domain
MLPIILTLGFGAVAALALRVATRPATFRVERSTVIAAPPERVYPLIDNFREWSRWSPWEKLDPELKRTFSGADTGVGAVYQWSGNRKAGEGRMEITRAEPPEVVVISLDFLKPFESHSTTEFKLEPQAGGTRVTWTMAGPNSLSSKMMQAVVSMDSLVGGDFERGLAAMKAAAEV